MKTEENNNDKLELLIKKLNELEIVQRSLNQDINQAKQEINEIRNDTKLSEQIKQIAFEKANTLEEGDTVRILNPTTSSETTGTIIGSTPKGYAKIKTNKGRITRRLPRNLRIINKAA